MKGVNEAELQKLEAGTTKNQKLQHSDGFKNAAALVYLSGGKKAYELFRSGCGANLPTIPTLQSWVQQNGVDIVEGLESLDKVAERMAKMYEEKKVDKLIFINEDATTVTVALEYKSSTQQIYGLVRKRHFGGHPEEIDQLKATAAKERATHVYLYVGVNPFDENMPALPIGFFATDNKFKTQDVISNWKKITEVFTKQGFHVIGYGADGDSRCIRAQSDHLRRARETIEKKHNKNFYQLQLGEEHEDLPLLFYQDFLHLFMKMMRRIIKHYVLKFGSRMSNVGNLVRLSERVAAAVSRARHDPMSVSLAAKLLDPEIINELKEGDEDQQVTALLLEHCKRIYDIASNSHLSFEDRVLNVWSVLFFSRLWLKSTERKLLVEKSAVSRKYDSMFTENILRGLQINSYSLLHVYIYCKEKNMKIAPWCLSSQYCENFFRLLRAFRKKTRSISPFSNVNNCFAISSLKKAVIPTSK